MPDAGMLAPALGESEIVAHVKTGTSRATRAANNRMRRLNSVPLVLALVLTACSAESEAPPPAAQQQAEIPANPLRNAYFGDLHLHTSYSLDAAVSGTDTVPDDAYRYARGLPVEYMGQRVQRRTPLDFLAVTDHAEYLGMVRLGRDPAGRYAGTQWPAQAMGVGVVALGVLASRGRLRATVTGSES